MTVVATAPARPGSFRIEAFGAGGPDLGRPTAVAGSDPTVLFAATRPGPRIAIWNRPAPEGWEALTEALLSAGPFSAHAEDAPNEAVAAVAVAAPAPVPPALERDMRFLAGLFSALSLRAIVRVRLEGITGDACRKWHADAIRLRMLCTYRGRGTEWRDGDGAPSTVDAPSVALMKGEGFAKGAGCVHRSPPVSRLPEAERRRLLLVVDEPGLFPS